MILLRLSLVTTYKSFIRPHLDNGDIIFDHGYNKSFHDNLDSIQYNALMAVTGAIKGTLKKNLFHQLDQQPLQHSWWLRKLCTSYMIYNLHIISAKVLPLQTSLRITR